MLLRARGPAADMGLTVDSFQLSQVAPLLLPLECGLPVATPLAVPCWLRLCACASSWARCTLGYPAAESAWSRVLSGPGWLGLRELQDGLLLQVVKWGRAAYASAEPMLLLLFVACRSDEPMLLLLRLRCGSMVTRTDRGWAAKGGLPPAQQTSGDTSNKTRSAHTSYSAPACNYCQTSTYWEATWRLLAVLSAFLQNSNYWCEAQKAGNTSMQKNHPSPFTSSG